MSNAKRIRRVFSVKEELLKKSRILAALRDTLLPKLVSGEIRVSSERDGLESEIVCMVGGL